MHVPKFICFKTFNCNILLILKNCGCMDNNPKIHIIEIICIISMNRSQIKDENTFRKFIESKDRYNNKIFFIISVLSIIIMWVSVKYFINYIFEIYLFIGLLGTFLVGYSMLASSKSIFEFSLTKVGYNSEKAVFLLNSKLMTGVGTVFLFISLLIGYILNSINS